MSIDFFLTNSIKVVNILASLVRLTTDSIGKSLCFLKMIANGCTKLNKSPLHWKIQPAVFLPFFLFCALAWNLIFCADVPADEPPHYHIRATVDLRQKMIVAGQKVIYTNNSSTALSELFFHIYPNRQYSQKEKEFMLRYSAYFKINPYPEGFPAGGLKVTSVRQDSDSLVFNVEGKDQTLLKVFLKNPLSPGQTVSITMDFAVPIPHTYGRLGWHEDIVKLSRWYPILSVYNDERGWNNHPFYPFHRPFFSEAARYSLELTVPEDQVVVHPGHLESSRDNTDSTKTLFLKTDLPIREFSLAMSPRYQLKEDFWEGIKIKSYHLPGDEFYGEQALAMVKDTMSFYTQRFGSYPHKEFSVAPVHLGYGGEQMSNLIFIDTRAYQLPKFLVRYFDFLISHETGHQWFYNIVGMDEFTEMWLEEGVNSYFDQEYLKNKYGKDASVMQLPHWLEPGKWILPDLTFDRLRDLRYKMIARLKGYDHPTIDELSSFQEPSSIFSVTYGKGSRIVGMLREQIGEAAFAKVFARIFKEFPFCNLSVKNFIHLCEEESKKDLAEFFNQWLYTEKKLDYAVKNVRGRKVTLANRAGIMMPIPYRVKTVSGGKKELVWDGQKQQETIEMHASIREVVIDPDQRYLDIDRTNNSWPRKIHVKPVAIYWPLYDIPAFLPDDSYNVVAGPEIIANGLGAKISFQKPYDQILYAASGYEFNDQLHVSRGGYQLNNVFNTQTALGFEIVNRTDLDDGSEDLVSAKTYIRRELRLARYALADINDHVTLYVIRNRGLDGALDVSEREDSRNISYLRRDEAIVGTAVHFGRSGPYPNPREGFVIDGLLENSGHFLKAAQYFYRAAVDAAFYLPVTSRSILAYRAKLGAGYPDDKNLFELGGWDGLRGYDRKTNRGSHVVLGSAEYRFPILDKVRWDFFDNIFGVESIGGVAFIDVGQNWFSSFKNSDLKKDVGLGLRFSTSIGAFLEKVIVRVDAARPLNEPDDDTRFWFGVNHAF